MLVLQRALLVLIASIHESKETILRLECGPILADFKIFEIGKALTGSVIQELAAANEIDCVQSCAGHRKCASYNMNVEEGKCELNSKTAYHEGTALVPRPGWTYKSTDFNQTLIGSTCQELEPCSSEMLCKDSCSYPYFECIKCNRTNPWKLCALPQATSKCASSPCKNNGTCFESHDSYSCVCQPDYTGANCEKEIDICYNLPCYNGGTCEKKGRSFVCNCAPGYNGTRCSEDINECESIPCQNGGSCSDRVNGYSCNCLSGFNGGQCQTNINECASNPCQNSGTCTDMVNGYSCQCLPGFTGTNCETDINECSSTPCANGAICFNQQNQYSCQCVPGYTGTNCHQDINECASSPCQNGGTCANLVDRFSCQCRIGFNGTLCEQNIDDCASSPCKNGGTCVDGVNQWSCTCPPGHSGLVCYPDCGQLLTGSSGSIASKNFPYYYPNNDDCTWNIDVGIGSRVRIEFLFFELETESQFLSRCVDYVSITEGASNSHIAKLCGSSLTQTIFESTTHTVRIKFHSDSSVARKGFSLLWRRL